jgi:hypothetical protein
MLASVMTVLITGKACNLTELHFTVDFNFTFLFMKVIYFFLYNFAACEFWGQSDAWFSEGTVLCKAY